MSILGDLQLIIIAILGAIASGAGAYFVGGWRGKKKADEQHKARENERYRTTRQRLDDAFRSVDDGGSNTDWLRERSKRKP